MQKCDNNPGSGPGRGAHNRSTPRVTVACDRCGAPVVKHPSHVRQRNFCNTECYRLWMQGQTQSAETRAKRSARLSGANAPTWKGGQSYKFKRGYKSGAYKEWRASVMARDEFTCQDCRQHGGYLTAHHIRSFADYPELRYVTANGVTLCEGCHAKRDRYFARLHPCPKKGG